MLIDIEISKTKVNAMNYIFCEHPVFMFVQIGGKCSNIVLDQCKKTGLVFDSVVAGVELVNCQSVQVQVIVSSISVSCILITITRCWAQLPQSTWRRLTGVRCS